MFTEIYLKLNNSRMANKNWVYWGVGTTVLSQNVENFFEKFQTQFSLGNKQKLAFPNFYIFLSDNFHTK